MRSMLLALLFALPVQSQSLEDDGPLAVGWQDVTFPDPSGGTLSGRLYYPATSAGQGTPPDALGGPYPLVGLLHRYLGDPSDYDILSTHVASHGFVLASIGTQTGPTALMRRLAQDMADMLGWFAGESSDPTSPYAGLVAPGPWGAIGHSMGGGALFYLIEDEPNVRVLVAMEPYRGGALGGFAGATANLQAFTGRLFLIGGDADLTAPAATHSYRYFTTASQAARNLHTTVAGLGHQGPTDEPPTGEPLTPAEQNALHRRLGTGFLLAELQGLEDLYVELIGEAVAGKDWTQESRTRDPVLWAAPSRARPSSFVAGVAGAAGDFSYVLASLGAASVPTGFGLLGLDLASAALVGSPSLPFAGSVELRMPVRASLEGVPLFVQALVAGPGGGTLTRTSSTVVPRFVFGSPAGAVPR